MSATQQTIDKFTRAYIECALWSSTDDKDEPLDKNYSLYDLAPETLQEIIVDCLAFQETFAPLLADLDVEQCGHDFWLTRNHHGAGFWDRGLGEIGTKLTEAAHAYGSCDLYVGDDGKVYL